MRPGIPMYVACYCMNDLKNPEKRNPKRVAFEKALRSSAIDIGHDKTTDCGSGGSGSNLNGFIPNNLEAPDMHKTANGKSEMGVAQNQLSLRSLDEIVNMSEIGEELIEMRHPNGKVFYIEDTRSNNSIETLERDENGNEGNKIGKGLYGAEVSEEEKSVIALLDDVLQGEDDGGSLPTPVGIHDYSRKFSVDSEMLPSVIETTIVATVHSSSDSSEQDLDDVPEDNEEQAGMASARVSPVSQLEYRAECARLAQNLVNDILESEAIKEALSENTEKTFNNVDDQNIYDKILRKASVTSMLSAQSVNDPMHSDFFKNKLSQLILQNNAPKIPKEANFSDTIHSKLKHSKSEADVGILDLIMLAKLNNNNNDDENEKYTQKPLTTIETNITSANDNDNSIPKPPKFDPILYNTINSLNTIRERPGLDKFIKADAESKVTSKPNIETDSVPFKTKLEAILKRGPSHRTQRRPEVEIRSTRPKTMIEITTLKDNTIEENNILKRPKRNSTTVISAEQLILNARKTLRPVQNGAIIS